MKDINSIIENLELQICYIEEDWDLDEYGEQAKECIESLRFAISYIKESKVVGTMVLNSKTYTISK